MSGLQKCSILALSAKGGAPHLDPVHTCLHATHDQHYVYGGMGGLGCLTGAGCFTQSKQFLQFPLTER